jgi:GT2 family glycosyltransferase
MRATVVVPTKNRPDALDRCLAALTAQGIDGLEVVVVDDASTDPVAVRAIAGARARVVQGEGRGPAAARNLGARSARAPVVLFTDDDCRPDPGWVAAAVARLESGAAVVAGPTLVDVAMGAPARAAQVVTNHLVEASMAAGFVAFAPTSNLACRADVLVDQPFDEAYPLAAGEDRDWCDRLVSSGRAIAYVPGAVVRHHPDLTVGRFWRQQFRYGRGAQRFRASGRRRRPTTAFYLELLGKGLRQGPGVGALVGLAQVATLAGVAAEAWSVRRR